MFSIALATQNRIKMRKTETKSNQIIVRCLTAITTITTIAAMNFKKYLHKLIEQNKPSKPTTSLTSIMWVENLKT